MIIKLVVLLIGALIATSTETSAQETSSTEKCVTPIGKPGKCMGLRDCTPLINLLQSKPLSEDNKMYLKNSQCGLKNETILVCCPEKQANTVAANPEKLALLPQPGKCGIIHSNSINRGETTDLDAFRWMALLEYSKPDNKLGHHCGGALINDRYILTAAHCVTTLPDKWSLKNVRLGEWDTATEKDCDKLNGEEICAEAHVDIPIEKTIPHEKFVQESRNRLYDIGLIRLSKSVSPSEFIQPICLPTSASSQSADDVESLNVVGWGANKEGLWSKTKLKTTVSTVSLSSCMKKYSNLNLGLETSQFCVESKVKNDTCHIDSGGPVVSFDITEEGKQSFYVVGIHSFSPAPCESEGWPDVYTKVGAHVDWILANIQP